MKFSHIADSHLGGWRQEELNKLNIASFIKAIDISIEEKVNFVLFAGDLFDNPFPSIEILKIVFSQFRRLKEKGIKSFIIGGSHDYSVSGKTFLEILEEAGLCEICKFEEDKKNNKIILKPCIYESFYIYGYPGKKSGLEVNDIKKIEIKEPYENHYRILMLHTTLKEASEDIPVDSISLKELPLADYYALGHIHIDFEKEINGKPVVYGGPTFPNNFKELEEIKYGKFYIVEVEGYTKIIQKKIIFKEVESLEIEIEDAINATKKILSILKRLNLKDKIILLKIFGNLKIGKPSDIKFKEIEEYLRKQGVYSFLKNTSKLEIEKPDINIDFHSKEVEKIEDIIIKKYEKENLSEYNKLIFPLMEALSLEKQEDETNAAYEERLFSEVSKILNIEL